MKILRYTGIGILSFILLLFIISLFLPKKVTISSSMLIHCQQDVAFDLVNDLKKWDSWAVWNKMDPNWKLTYLDKTKGEGAGYRWESNNDSVGRGSLTVLTSIPNDSIYIRMDIQGWGSTYSFYSFKKVNDSTQVTVGFYQDFAWNPFTKLIFSFMDMTKSIETDFDINLNNMKQILEKMPESNLKKVLTEATQEESMNSSESTNSK